MTAQKPAGPECLHLPPMRDLPLSDEPKQVECKQCGRRFYLGPHGERAEAKR